MEILIVIWLVFGGMAIIFALGEHLHNGHVIPLTKLTFITIIGTVLSGPFGLVLMCPGLFRKNYLFRKNGKV